MKRRVLAITTGMLLGSACTLSRPDGAYNAEDLSVTDAGDAAQVASDGQLQITALDSGFKRDDLLDGGGTVPEAVQRLLDLEGMYLMRFDVFSTATADSVLTKVTSHARVSYLSVVSLTIDKGGTKLLGQEHLCYQTFENTCKTSTGSCTLTSAVSQPSRDVLQVRPLPAVPRNYILAADGTLTGAETVLGLGYDDGADNSLPVAGDARIWDAPVGGVREGLAVDLSLSVAQTRCQLYTVQRLVTSLAGKVVTVNNAPSLVGATFLLTAKSTGFTLGSDSTTCKSGSASATDPTSADARFAKHVPATDNLFACPSASAWDVMTPVPPAP